MEEVDLIKQFNVYEKVDEIIDDYGFDKYGEVAYYCYESEEFKDPINNIASKLKLLKLFELDFKDYIERTCNGRIFDDIVPSNHVEKILKSSSKIIPFNYTLTVKRLQFQNVEHIMARRYIHSQGIGEEHYQRDPCRFNTLRWICSCKQICFARMYALLEQ